MYAKEDLIQFNEIMLGRGVPVEQDGIGYNKPDYSVCVNYYYGLSDAQYADLANRLIKYTQTQLKIDKDKMIDTAKYFEKISKGTNKKNGVSIDIRKDETLISFSYNQLFIETIKKQSERRWDSEAKKWIVPNYNIQQTLEELGKVGADVKNALEYASNNKICSFNR